MTVQTVYRLYDTEGGLIYIGMTDNWGRRRRQHRQTKPEFRASDCAEFEYFPDIPSAYEREQALIAEYRPRYNGGTKRMGRPPGTHPAKRYTERIDFYVTPEMKAWAMEYGGGAYIRQLIKRDAEAALANMELSSTEAEREAVRRVIGD